MIIPGIFEETKEEALKKINLVANAVPVIQLDIADGRLVDGKTFLDLSFLSGLNISAQIQLHLMTQKPESFIMTLPHNIKDVCAQAEAYLYNPLWKESFHDVLRAKNIRVGLSFNSDTPFDDFKESISKCDYIQLMGVRPGGQHRPFIAKTIEKIKEFRHKFPDIRVQVDGGMDQSTIDPVAEAGVDDIIVGSAIFNTPDPLESYKNFMLQFDNAHRNFHHSQQRTGFGDEKPL